MSINHQESEMKSWYLIFIVGFSVFAVVVMELLFNSSPKSPQAIEKSPPGFDIYQKTNSNRDESP